jgi:4-hydroxythreonine-4-phosphate dehydrogenase
MLALTLGDPHGVGIELIAGLLADDRRRAVARQVPVVLVGSAWHWRDQTERLARLGHPVPGAFQTIGALAAARAPGLYFLDIGQAADAQPAEKLTEIQRGGLAVRALAVLRTLPRTGQVAVVTGPIDKHAAASAGFRHPGQTEYFEELWNAPAVMTLAGPRLRVGLVTNHLALRDVPRHIDQTTVVKKGELFHATLVRAFGIARPRIAVCGLNPHAGDQGLFGDEEGRVLAGAIAELSGKHPGAFTGPLPADTAFHAGYHGTYDGVLAMYHDQGLGPLKTVHFDDAVNLSGGLPHFRAAPDHGPARDLFMKRQASPASFALAFDLACRYLGTA